MVLNKVSCLLFSSSCASASTCPPPSHPPPSPSPPFLFSRGSKSSPRFLPVSSHATSVTRSCSFSTQSSSLTTATVNDSLWRSPAGSSVSSGAMSTTSSKKHPTCTCSPTPSVGIIALRLMELGEGSVAKGCSRVVDVSASKSQKHESGQWWWRSTLAPLSSTASHKVSCHARMSSVNLVVILVPLQRQQRQNWQERPTQMRKNGSR